ncbi:MAG: hypothetical protein VB013_14815 [Anaerolineaceae bacterium]|jgi:hypothetical protein|nr:hypothetical protein [Anaerolineaceae bacterium]
MATKTKKRSVSSTPETKVVESKTAARTGARTFAPDFSADIEYTKQDLKKIAYLAGAFFVILIVLSFILR